MRKEIVEIGKNIARISMQSTKLKINEVKDECDEIFKKMLEYDFKYYKRQLPNSRYC